MAVDCCNQVVCSISCWILPTADAAEVEAQPGASLGAGPKCCQFPVPVMYSPAPAVLAKLFVKLQLSMVMLVANTDRDPYSVPKPLNWQLVTSRVPVTFAQTAVVRTTVRLVVGVRADSKMQLSKARDFEAPAIVKQKGVQTT